MSTTQSPPASRTQHNQTLGYLLCQYLGIKETDSRVAETRITDICTDSRRVRPGALFIALAGARGDGAQFLHDAQQRGAAAIMSDRDIESPPGIPWVRVPDARDAVSKLAAGFFGLGDIQSRGDMSVTGITGTNGKSTIAFMVREILRTANRPAALFGTIEYDLVSRRIDAPLTTPDPIDLVHHLVEAHSAGARDAVMEVSSHSLDQRRTSGIQISTGIFTNLTQDHLDYHGTMELYALAKRRLFQGLSTGATAVINFDDPAGEQMASGCAARLIRFGIDSDVDLRATQLTLTKSGCAFHAEYEGRSADFEIRLAGRHNVYNALAAIGAGIASGIDMNRIATALSSLHAVPGRLQRVDTGDRNFDVFVDYAHTDDALRNVLTALRPLTKGRLWCVFGCGGDRDRSKRPRMAQAVADCADGFIITSDNPRTEDPLAIIADIESGLSPDGRIRGQTEPDRATAIQIAMSRLRHGDTLLIAGKGHENYQIIGTNKIHFDDVETAEAALKAL